MSISKQVMIIGTATLMAASWSAQAQEDAVTTAIKGGKVLADIRLRYETVDDSINDDADGLTLRTRLGYQTGSLAGFKLLGEFTDTRTVAGVDEFAPEEPGYAVIADPSNTELNRAVISYEGFANTWLGLGRQRIILDNARWVGNVGWRQKEQTFDAASVDYTLAEDWKLSYDYMTRVQGITEAFDRDVNNHILNIGFSGWDIGALVGYAYLLEDDDSNDTSNTYGLRLNGKVAGDNLSWMYTAEYARQNVALDKVNPMTGRDDYDADYYALSGGVGFGAMTVLAGYEVLGSDDGDYGLQTPLATKHAFNGWADMFLATPQDGLHDAYIDLGANWLGLKWGAVYHDYRADSGSDRYGSEIDLLLAKKFSQYYTVGLKYADYQADDFSEDRKKLWVWIDFAY
jgi:hypothetical protein